MSNAETDIAINNASLFRKCTTHDMASFLGSHAVMVVRIASSAAKHPLETPKRPAAAKTRRRRGAL
ncbi:hypothetical protein [Desulfovibrio sp. TomC]|uniref:hypothetical protein n=1 Tax=Desulfovibrio sp. TomC TaxID=1562888 RepID=UPI0005758C3C|nr:hypothetical protein [Desulfovibrio sp. TomC]KHK04519.1 hypothetical protein NY78_0300 [Desulfovibrio sp. TomC]